MKTVGNSIVIVTVCSVLAAAAFGALAADKAKPIAAYVTWTGPDSREAQPRHVRADSRDEWMSLWSSHTGGKFASNHVGEPIGFPDVDFDQCTVVGCFKGNTHNSSGIFAVSIQEEREVIRLRIDERTYQTASFGPGGDGGAVKVTPYGIFVLPRTAKPIIVEENTQSLKNQPDRWTRRAELAPPAPRRAK